MEINADLTVTAVERFRFDCGLTCRLTFTVLILGNKLLSPFKLKLKLLRLWASC